MGVVPVTLVAPHPAQSVLVSEELEGWRRASSGDRLQVERNPQAVRDDVEVAACAPSFELVVRDRAGQRSLLVLDAQEQLG